MNCITTTRRSIIPARIAIENEIKQIIVCAFHRSCDTNLAASEGMRVEVLCARCVVYKTDFIFASAAAVCALARYVSLAHAYNINISRTGKCLHSEGKQATTTLSEYFRSIKM